MPYHLLSGLGMYAFLLSSAKTTNCTFICFPLFLKVPATGLWCLAHTKETEIPQKLCKTGNLSELMHSAVSELPLKEARSTPPPHAICSARAYTTHGLRNGFLIERLSPPPKDFLVNVSNDFPCLWIRKLSY
jgi:hypothetical protein